MTETEVTEIMHCIEAIMAAQKEIAASINQLGGFFHQIGVRHLDYEQKLAGVDTLVEEYSAEIEQLRDERERMRESFDETLGQYKNEIFMLRQQICPSDTGKK